MSNSPSQGEPVSSSDTSQFEEWQASFAQKSDRHDDAGEDEAASSAGEPPFSMSSTEGSFRIDYIRNELSLPRTITADEVQATLVKNLDIIRHAALGRIPNPRAYIKVHGDTYEPSFTPRGQLEATSLFQAITEVDWTSDAIRGLFILLSRWRMADEFTVVEELRKLPTGILSDTVMNRILAQDAELAAEVDKIKTEEMYDRLQRKNSMLRNEVRR